MKENRDEIIIQATPEEVWEVLTDFDRHAEWNPLIYQAKGVVEVGRRIKVSARSGSLDMKYRCLVVKVELHREFQWKWHVVLPFLIGADHIFKIEPITEKSVHFINREIFKGILVPFLTKLLFVQGKESMVAMDKALKERVEKQKNTA